MIRAVVLFLVFPALLMPPGVCVCGVARSQPATPTAPRTPPEAVQPEGAVRQGGCCSKCRAVRPPVESPPAGKVPDDRPHAPMCPAVNSTVATKFVEPPVQLPDFPPAVVDLLPEPGVPPITVHHAPADTPTGPPTPRYISFRVLLI